MTREYLSQEDAFSLLGVEFTEARVGRNGIVRAFAQDLIRNLADAVECGKVKEDVGQHLQADIRIGVAIIPATDDSPFRAFAGHEGGCVVRVNDGFVRLTDKIRRGGGERAHLIAKPFAVTGIGFCGGHLRVAADDGTVHQGAYLLIGVQSDGV